MRVGTPGFQPARLIQAREARGILSREALARLIGKHASTIQRWEQGESSPEPEALQKVASVLNVRMEHFIRPATVNDGAVFFRSLASTLKRDLAYQKARIRWLHEVATAINDYVVFPDLNLPNLLGDLSYRQLRDDDLERMASELRSYWGLGSDPIANVVETMERAGIVVAAEEMGTSKLDGLTQWFTKPELRPYVLLADDKMSFARRQMDAAHEMAHCILHRHASPMDLQNDFTLIESQAFRLASAFLMPSDRYADELGAPTLNSMLIQKDRWKVSIKAQIKRVQDLEMLDSDDARFLYKSYSARGWSRGEPLDDEWSLQRPRMLAESLNAIVDSQTRSKEELLSSEFSVPASDIESLCSLPTGWFDASQASIVKLVPRVNEPRTDKSDGRVIKFDR